MQDLLVPYVLPFFLMGFYFQGLLFQEGTYKPNTIVPFTTPSTDNRNKGYCINKNIEIYGGFDGTETQRSQRDYRSNITILSGDIGKEITLALMPTMLSCLLGL